MSEKREALIIATYEYEDEGLSQLVAPSHDAEDLARVLQDSRIGDFNVRILLNPPLQEANEVIEGFFLDRRPEDLLLLYFSCHGIKDKDGRLYFATKNTKRKLVQSTAIASRFVHDLMRSSRSRQKVLVLDCCFAGAFARGVSAKAPKTVDTKSQFNQARGLAVLTASDEWQYSFEGEAISGTGVRSVFTRNLVYGLESGEADTDRDGSVSLDELYDFTFNRVVDETPEQRPEKYVFGAQGRVIIARNPVPIAIDTISQESDVEPEVSVPRLDENDWAILVRTIKHGKCTPFIGPAACFGSVPTDQVIAREWAREYEYPRGDSGNLSRVAQFLADQHGRFYPHRLLQTRLQNAVLPDFTKPGEFYGVFASLPLPVYITTNFDRFLVEALKAQNRQPIRDFCRWNDLVREMPSALDEAEPTPYNPLVFHLYGYSEIPESMVLTEDDFRNFVMRISAEPNRLPPRIQEAIVGSSLLFIGYDLTQPKFQVLSQSLASLVGRNYQHRFGKYQRGDVTEFAHQLRQRWDIHGQD
jgi:uncharacterized caspase-like protein